jgi:hypothetical protein
MLDWPQQEWDKNSGFGASTSVWSLVILKRVHSFTAGSLELWRTLTAADAGSSSVSATHEHSAPGRSSFFLTDEGNGAASASPLGAKQRCRKLVNPSVCAVRSIQIFVNASACVPCIAHLSAELSSPTAEPDACARDALLTAMTE